MSNLIALHIREFVSVDHEKLVLTLKTPKIYRDPVLILLDALTKDTQCWQSYDSDVRMSLIFKTNNWPNVRLTWPTDKPGPGTVTFYFKK